jgi:Protein of unknown function (DUF3465)
MNLYKLAAAAVIIVVAGLSIYRHSAQVPDAGPALVQTPVTATSSYAADQEGSRHQRFVLRTRSGITVLVAHNIDLAPRLEDLREGESLRLSGEYVWNERGGLLHWTHRDPNGHHAAGYIERDGRRYQ